MYVAYVYRADEDQIQKSEKEFKHSGEIQKLLASGFECKKLSDTLYLQGRCLWTFERTNVNPPNIETMRAMYKGAKGEDI